VLPVPGAVIRPVLTPIVMHILKQDIRMLGQQQEVVNRFGRAQYISTEVDILGSHVRYLMRQAERGTLPASPPPFTRELTIRA
jgi:hypothetical protein